MLRERREFGGIARVLGTALYALIALGTAVAAASSVAAEREQDTWLSLLTTDLTGPEIVQAKLFGAAWSTRWFLVPLAALWVAALATGSMHPFGFLLGVVALFVFLWFAAALGTFFSLTRRNSGRALGWTVGTLVFINGGYLLILVWFVESWLIAAGSTPFILSMVFISYEEVWHLSGFVNHQWASPLTLEDDGGEAIAACVVCLIGYATAAAGLTAYCVAAFDRIVDRPDRSSGRPASAPAARPEPGRVTTAEVVMPIEEAEAPPPPSAAEFPL